MVPMVGRLCHGAKPSPRQGPPVKGCNGLFKGFSTVGRVRDAKGNKKAPEGA